MGAITAWRITKREYQKRAFSGEGAREYGGRFNSEGTPMVYTAGSLSLALSELLVRVKSRRRLGDRLCLPVTFDEKHVHVLAPDELPGDWDARPYGVATQRIGDTWAERKEALVLRVPSVVVPQEHNFLLNPRHPTFEALTLGPPVPLRVDPRLLE